MLIVNEYLWHNGKYKTPYRYKAPLVKDCIWEYFVDYNDKFSLVPSVSNFNLIVGFVKEYHHLDVKIAFLDINKKKKNNTTGVY